MIERRGLRIGSEYAADPRRNNTRDMSVAAVPQVRQRLACVTPSHSPKWHAEIFGGVVLVLAAAIVGYLCSCIEPTAVAFYHMHHRTMLQITCHAAHCGEWHPVR
jgi:hypothetical protein